MTHHTQRWSAALLLAVGIGLNLGSNFVGGGEPSPPPTDTCAPGSERLTARPAATQGYPDAPLAAALQVEFTCVDSGSNRVFGPAGFDIQWSVGSGDGKVNGATTLVTKTGIFGGIAEVHWQLGPVIGTQTVIAQAAGRAVSFNAVAVAPGPAGDCTVSTGGTNFQTPIWRIAGTETWTTNGSPYRAEQVEIRDGATLTIEPGVRVCALHLAAGDGGRIVARGTAAAPILLAPRQPGGSIGITLFGGVPQPPPGLPPVPVTPPPSRVPANAALSELHHVHGEELLQIIADGQSLSLRDSRFRVSPGLRTAAGCASIFFGSSFSPADLRHDVQRTVFEGYGGSLPGCDAAVTLDQTTLPAPAAGTPPTTPWVFSARIVGSLRDALLLRHDGSGPGWSLQQCELSGSGRHGAVFESNAGRVSGCRIAGNAEFGVVNRGTGTPFTIDARSNWWGDAAGPLGPAGDGVFGSVDASSPLAAAPTLGY